MKRKNEEMKAKIYSLRSQKMELDRKVEEMKSTLDSLKEEQKVMESTFEEKQNEIRTIQEKGSNFGKDLEVEVMALKERLQQKEAEIEDLKHRFEVPFKSRWGSSNDSTNLPEIVSAQEKTQTENKERNGQSHNQPTEDEIQDRKENNDGPIETDEQIKRQETLQITDGEQGNINDDSQDAGSEGVIAKESDEKIEDGKENATIKDEQRGQFENNTNGGGQDFSLKQLAENSKIPADEKRKHEHVNRTKGKRWRRIVKNRLLGNSGISESHGAVNLRSRKVNRDEQDELKDRNEYIEREEDKMDNKDPSKDTVEAKLQKPGSHDDIQDTQMKIVNDTNQQVTLSDNGMHPREQSLDEVRESGKQEESGVEQGWSRRHINIVEKNARHEKTAVFRELGEIKGANVQEQQKDVIEEGSDDEDNDADFTKESQSDFADEDEYKEETDESEFQAGL